MFIVLHPDVAAGPEVVAYKISTIEAFIPSDSGCTISFVCGSTLNVKESFDDVVRLTGTARRTSAS